ncbi:MAG TPA: ATP-binding protein, partial [Acidobacteriaceae bacterium]|nr:ATP-binding protein [Acidobacteriaceae bacterium]
MRQRVFLKLLAAMVLVVLAAAAMLDISQQNILESSLQNQLVRSLAESAQALAQRIVVSPAVNLGLLAQEEARAVDARVTILNKGGNVIADFAANGVDVGATTAAKLPMDSSEMRAILVQHRAFGKSVNHGTLNITAPAGDYIVRLGYSMHDTYETLHMVRRSLLWATLLGLLLAILLAALLAQAVSRRLARIVDFAHRLARGDFGARIVDSGSDEIAAVANALDATAARVEAVFRTLQDSRKEMETVLDSMEEAVIAVDAQSHVHWSNRVMERLMGGAVRPGNALVQTIRDPDLLACVEKALSRRVTAHVRARTVLPGRIFDVSAAPMLGGSAVVVLHDVTEIDRVEKTRRDFIANVSHELRTPLTSISGYAETMLEEDDGLPTQARDFLSIISRNASRMTRLTEDLLALARIESGEYKLNRRPVEAELLIDEAAAILTGLLMDRNVVLEKGESPRERVMADTDSILQVLSNLLENAVKYGGGARIVIGARSVSGAVEFYVQDFGAGIPSEHLTRIFERFYRVDKARSRESGGTGLGLSIAKHIILAHGGTIRAESELARGSTFFFTLPVAPPAELEEEHEEHI